MADISSPYPSSHPPNWERLASAPNPVPQRPGCISACHHGTRGINGMGAPRSPEWRSCDTTECLLRMGGRPRPVKRSDGEMVPDHPSPLCCNSKPCLCKAVIGAKSMQYLRTCPSRARLNFGKPPWNSREQREPHL